MKTESDNVVPCKVKSGEFISIVSTMLSFNPGCKITFDEWNDMYHDFRVSVSAFFPEYVASRDPIDLVKEWAQNEYADYRLDTHDYCLKTNRKSTKVVLD